MPPVLPSLSPECKRGERTIAAALGRVRVLQVGMNKELERNAQAGALVTHRRCQPDVANVVTALLSNHFQLLQRGKCHGFCRMFNFAPMSKPGAANAE
jgi:hypothetical protein